MNRLKELMKPLEFTLTMDDVNPELMQILFGNSDDHPTTFDFEYKALKQVRKHKKKRINKKWAKRYGMISEKRIVQGLRMIEYDDGSVGFIK